MIKTGARLTNDALLSLDAVMVEADAYSAGTLLAQIASACGKPASATLIGRLGREELAALMELPPLGAHIEPGASVRCQVAFPPLRSEVDEVRLRVASAEPRPGHPPPRFLAE